MSSSESAARRLRAHVENPEIAVMPGCYDALSAILAERAGFDAVFSSGLSLSASLLGKPDLGYLTMSENLARVRDIARSVTIPLVADMDTGYGNALNVRRTVEEAMDAGAAGIILEDQEWPKRCGHMEAKRVVPRADHARRIRAAADVRADRQEELIIIGRTDAREPLGIDAAIDRGQAYYEAGADIVFVEAPQTRDELVRVAEAFDAPTFANMIEGGVTPYLTAAELEEIGFDIVVYPLSALFAATHSIQDVYTRLREHGSAEGADTVSFEAFETIIEAEADRQQERRYADLYDE